MTSYNFLEYLFTLSRHRFSHIYIIVEHPYHATYVNNFMYRKNWYFHWMRVSILSINFIEDIAIDRGKNVINCTLMVNWFLINDDEENIFFYTSLFVYFHLIEWNCFSLHFLNCICSKNTLPSVQSGRIDEGKKNFSLKLE